MAQIRVGFGVGSGPDAAVHFLKCCFPPLTGVLLSSCVAKKKVSKEEGDPGSVPAAPVPCATRNAGRLRNSGLRPSNSARRLPPAFLRCSAPPKGPGKPSGVETGVATMSAGAKVEILIFALFSGSTATGHITGCQSSRDAFRAPLRGAEQRRWAGGSRLALFEPQASSGKPPGLPSSARYPTGAPTQGWLFLWLLSFCHQKESTPAPQARNP